MFPSSFVRLAIYGDLLAAITAVFVTIVLKRLTTTACGSTTVLAAATIDISLPSSARVRFSPYS